MIDHIVADDFKETELGSLPLDWTVIELQDAVTFTRKPRELDLSQHEVIPFIPMEHIPDDGVFTESFLTKTAGEISSGSYCENGDILLAKITPSFENGKQAIVANIPTDFAYATTEVYAIKPNPTTLDKMFLFHYFRLPAVRHEIAGRMEGTTGRQRIPKPVIERRLIPLPPLPEQRRIANVLNAIQEAIVAQDDVIAAARAFKHSLLKRLFTYGPSQEPAETKETEIGEIPAHWEVKKLYEVASFTSKPRHLALKEYPEVPFVPMDFIPDQGIFVEQYELKSGTDTRSGTYCEQGDFLLAKITPSFENGKQAIVSSNFPLPFAYATTEVYALKGIPGQAEQLFLFYYFKQQSIRQDLAGKMEGTTGRQRIPKTVIENYIIPIPSLGEQKQIACMLSDIDHKIAAEEDRKAAVQAFFKALLHQLMTGQLRLHSDAGLPGWLLDGTS